VTDDRGGRTDGNVLRAGMVEIVERHGPWATHNVRLADGVFTISPQAQTAATKLVRIVQVIEDICGGLGNLRVLDLACNEGLYALELAARGASVVGVDARSAHIEKAKFAASALGLDARFEQLDVREIRGAGLGRFDVVLAAGILYHLDAPDLIRLVEQLPELASCVVIDTHVSPYAPDSVDHESRSYRGMYAQEHDSSATDQERLAAGRQSYGTDRAFHITKPSLLRLLEAAGFSSVLEVQLPRGPERLDTRPTLVAFARPRVTPRVVPAAHVGEGRALPEPPSVLPNRTLRAKAHRLLRRAGGRRR
jgi:SAM-dependent methyltransferase